MNYSKLLFAFKVKELAQKRLVADSRLEARDKKLSDEEDKALFLEKLNDDKILGSYIGVCL